MPHELDASGCDYILCDLCHRNGLMANFNPGAASQKTVTAEAGAG
jgi:hypothetical protein